MEVPPQFPFGLQLEALAVQSEAIQRAHGWIVCELDGGTAVHAHVDIVGLHTGPPAKVFDALPILVEQAGDLDAGSVLPIVVSALLSSKTAWPATAGTYAVPAIVVAADPGVAGLTSASAASAASASLAWHGR